MKVEGDGEIRSKANFAGEVPGETRKCRSKYGIRLKKEGSGSFPREKVTG